MSDEQERPAPTPEQIAEVNRRIDAALAPVIARVIVRLAREQAEEREAA